MKKLLLAVALSNMLLLGNVQASIPTTDMTSAGLLGVQLGQLRETLTNAKSQLKRQEKILDSLKGSKSIQSMIDSEEFKKYLPMEAKSIMEKYKAGNYDAVAQEIMNLSENNKISGKQKQIVAKIKQSYEKNMYGNQAHLDKLFENTGNRYKQLTRLINSIDNTTDAKASADLQNRIQAEQAVIQLQMNQIKLYEMMMKAESRMISDQVRQLRVKRNSSENIKYYKPEPTFRRN